MEINNVGSSVAKYTAAVVAIGVVDTLICAGVKVVFHPPSNVIDHLALGIGIGAGGMFAL